MTKEERSRAIQNYKPLAPDKYELGGGFYYTCHWLSCNEQLKRWWKYCPSCGQAILWEDDYTERGSK